MHSSVTRKGKGLGLPIDTLGLVEKVGGQDDDHQDVCPAVYARSIDECRPPL